MHTITVKIPEKLEAALEEVSARRRVSKSALVRASLEESLKKELNRSRANAYALMKNGLGVVRSGRKDLASNPKHMKGFGS